METMKAMVINSYGGPEVIEAKDVPIPEITSDEILIKVHAVGVNPLDWKVRAGFLDGMLSYDFPLILGWDVSGTVAKVGAGVSGMQVGDEVYALADMTRNGACAEYAVLKALTAARKPSSLDHVQAASLPMAALTAWQAIFGTGELITGQKILIHAAAGGIGSMAVQFARWKGARVIGTASGKNGDFVLELGADEIIDYTKGAFEDSVSEVDIVLDSLGGDVQERSWKVLAKGGILVSLLGPPDESKKTDPDIRGAAMLVQPDRAQLEEIGRLIDGGVVKTVVSEILPMDDIARAHEISETHHVRGKIVLKVRD